MKQIALRSLCAGLVTVAIIACAAPTASTSPQAGTVAESEAVRPSSASTAEGMPVAPAALPVDSTLIALGEQIEITGAGAEVTDNGVHITAGGNYLLRGTLADGIIEVTAPGADVHLTLDGVDITNSDGPAIVFYKSGASRVTLAAGTENTLVDGGKHKGYDATLWSSATLTIDGSGNLNVTGHYQEGIASEMHIDIDGGNIWVTAHDDGLNANNDGVSIITINDGYLFVNAGGDGLDSNGAITFNGGTTITMSALTDMSGGIDADGAVTVNGGTVIATGARNALPAAASTQHSLVVNYTAAQVAETLAAIVAPDGTPLLTLAPEVAYQQLVFSSAEVAEGVSYTVYTGGTVDGAGHDGWYPEGLYTPGAQVVDVDTTSVQQMGPEGPGGNRP